MSMSQKFIFIPVCVQMLLTLFVYLRLKSVKAAALAAKTVDLDRRSVHIDAWPDDVVRVNNNITSQFQVPVLFYVAVLSLCALGAVDGIAIAVASLFSLSRIGHAAVHLTSNHVPTRFKFFTLGIILVVVLTVLILKAALLGP